MKSEECFIFRFCTTRKKKEKKRKLELDENNKEKREKRGRSGKNEGGNICLVSEGKWEKLAL